VRKYLSNISWRRALLKLIQVSIVKAICVVSVLLCSCIPVICLSIWGLLGGIRQPFMSWMQKDSVRNNPEYFAFHENRSIDQENQGAFINKEKKKKGKGGVRQSLIPLLSSGDPTEAVL
jgi:hypothetical protein